MALNLELKIGTKSHKELVSKINLIGGKYLDTLNQKDTYFIFDKGLLKLRKQNREFQLIKYKRNEKRGGRWSNYSILFLKGEQVEDYLKDLFEVETIVKKERKLYLYKNTRIHLDDVRDLGKFLELETVVNKISKNKAVSEFNEVVKFLHLDITQEILKSYRDLLIESKNKSKI